MIAQQLSEQFARWEERTRGHLVYHYPVPPEPPFAPFPGHYLQGADQVDDGKRPTLLSSLVKSLWAKPNVSQTEEPEAEPEVRKLERGPLIEFPLYLPDTLDPRAGEFDAFIRGLFACRQPLAFEIVGAPDIVTAQLAVSPDDSDHVRQQLRADSLMLSLLRSQVR